MKLINNTKISTAVLEPLIYKAGKAVGARTSKTAVVVNHGSNGVRGKACHYANFSPSFYSRKKVRGGRTSCDGFFQISLPTSKYNRLEDALDNAQRFYKVALHEWGHIRDFQHGEFFGKYYLNHDKRPHEIRADEYTDKALERKEEYIYEELMALAVALETHYRGR